MRGNHLYDLHYTASEGAAFSLSSPSDLSQGPQWAPPAMQEISIEDFETATRRGASLEPISIMLAKEGSSGNPDSGSSSSTSSHSDSSELFATTLRSCLAPQCNFSSHRSFISKPIHPLSFPDQTLSRETLDSVFAGLSELDSSIAIRDGQRLSNASCSFDYADVSESIDPEMPGNSRIPSDGFKCGLCGRFLSQRSPWSLRRIVRSGDMPITGVLSCCHVFHAECLEQTTPKTCKNDPPCPLCVRLEGEISPDQRGSLRLRTGFPRIRAYPEEGPSRSWGCTHVGDCVEGAFHAPSRNAMVLLSRNRIKKNLSLKGNLSKEFPGKLKRSGPDSSQHFSGGSFAQGPVGCSKPMAESSLIL